MRHLGRSPWQPFVLLVLGTWLGGFFLNSVTADGRVVANGTEAPIGGAQLSYGIRQYATADDGSFAVPNLPRGARITVIAPGWTRREFTADEHLVHLTVGVVNFNVNDQTTDKGIPKPEARDAADVQKKLGVGSDTGSIAVPLPPPDVVICAAGYESQTIHVVQPIHDVKLRTQAGGGCPAPPPSPSPSVSPSASPSVAPSASPATTP